MRLTRKQFLKAGSILTGGIILQGNSILSKLQEKNNNFRLLRDNFGVYTERGGTIAFYATDDTVIVIDSQFPDTAKNFMDSLKAVTARKIDLLMNTHHHTDHTSGNIYLKDYSKMMAAHENCVALQKKFYGNNPDKPQAYAGITFADEWTIDLGKEKIRAKHFGPGHTGGDAVIHFQNSNIVHMGDLVFNQIYPYLDGPGGSSLKGWISVLEMVLSEFGKDTLFVFGHGAEPDLVKGSLNDLIAMKDYLSALTDFVSKEIKNGRSKEQVLSATEIPNTRNIKEQREGMRKMNLEFAYNEISQK